MDAIETETIELGGQTYRITIYPDGDSSNPLEECSEMGTILSLNRRHVNFDPRGVEEALEGNADSVPLSYYEHGLCLWSVAGELPCRRALRFGATGRRLAARRRYARFRRSLRRADPSAFHAQAGAPGLHGLHAVVQWRRVWLHH